jgi:hypothetical protein
MWHVWEKRRAWVVLVVKLKGKKHSEHLGVYGRVILEEILKKSFGGCGMH